MTEVAQVKRGPGRPRKNPVVHEAKRETKRPLMRAKPNWEEVNINVDFVDRFKLPAEFLAKWGQEYAFQWVTDSIFGQPDPQSRGTFEKGGWTPLHQEDFDGELNGIFMKKDDPNEINLGGQVLMARPRADHDKAKKIDLQKARDQIHAKERQLQGGDIPTTLDSRHPTAIASNRISKSYERIDIPKD